MLKNLAILAVLIVIVALPFALRRTEAVGGGDAWRAGDPVLVIVTPHNEAIRYEFERGFSKWHQAKFGRPVKIDWRSIGGTTEIGRYLTGEFALAAKAWWTRGGKTWPANATDAVVASSPPDKPELLEVYKAFRATDDADALTTRIDLFFGGGEFDHTIAFRQGMTVRPWNPGEEPKHLFTMAQDSDLIPEKIGGEIWRTPTLFGNAVSTFGICYNFDRLRDLGAAPPRRWEDLAEPVFFGQVGVADPSKSGSVAKAFEMLIHQRMHDTVRDAGFSDAQIGEYERQIDPLTKTKGYKRGDLPPGVPAAYQAAVERGWRDGLALVQKIGANARYFTDSASKVAIDVSTGDAAVGMSIDFYGRYQAQTSRAPDGRDRMAYLTPAGGSSVSCDPISLLRGAGGGAEGRDDAERRKNRADRRALAVRFIEYVLSEDGQKLWTYKPGEPGGPEKFALRRLPIRRDFYPSTHPVMQEKHVEHARHAADALADPTIDPYVLARQFIYYPRWTGSHFGFHREWIRVSCVDAGDELKDAWRAIINGGGPDKQPEAMALLQKLPDVPLDAGRSDVAVINWRTAPDLIKKYDKLDYTREWTIALRANYRKAKDLIK